MARVMAEEVSMTEERDIVNITSSLVRVQCIIRYTTLTYTSDTVSVFANDTRYDIRFEARVTHGWVTIAAHLGRIADSGADPFLATYTPGERTELQRDCLCDALMEHFYVGSIDPLEYVAKLKEAIANDEGWNAEPEADVALDAWRDKEHENAE